MKFSDQELQLVREKYGITPPPIGFGGSKTEEGPGYVSRVMGTAKKSALGIGESIVRGSELIDKGIKTGSYKDVFTGVGRAGLGSAAGAIRTVASPLTEALSPVISAGIGKLDPKVQQDLADMAQRIESWSAENPDAAANIGDGLEILTTLFGIKGVKPSTSAVKTSLSKGLSSIPKPPPGTGNAIMNKTSGVLEKTGQFLDNTISEASRIPSRMSTNLAERAAKQSTIKSLPSKIAQKAAQDGIDPNDVKFLYKLPKEVKANAKELADVTKKFSEGSTKKNPIEIVGKPIVERIKELNKQAGLVGKNLGDTANTIGNFTSKEITPALLSELKKVPGLNGIRLGKGNKLIFSDTVLSDLSKSDKTSIQKIFTQAAKPGTGKSKHLLRQELFEILGGKKKSLQAITDTQDKAFQAIRKALSDVLETKNPAYKKLSNDYRKIIQPLQDMKKLLKVTGDEDILNMSAGLLARRLTSNAASNPQIRAILRAMDKAVKGGKSQVRVETLQDVYNILNKYYDISGKTSFQGQVKAGIESAKGIGDVALQAVKGIAGETPAVRQKALEAIFKEIFN